MLYPDVDGISRSSRAQKPPLTIGVCTSYHAGTIRYQDMSVFYSSSKIFLITNSHVLEKRKDLFRHYEITLSLR